MKQNVDRLSKSYMRQGLYLTVADPSGDAGVVPRFIDSSHRQRGFYACRMPDDWTCLATCRQALSGEPAYVLYSSVGFPPAVGTGSYVCLLSDRHLRLYDPFLPGVHGVLSFLAGPPFHFLRQGVESFLT